MMQRSLGALLSIALVGHVSGFNPPAVVPAQRAPAVQSQTSPYGVVRPGTRPYPMPSFLPATAPSNPALSATLRDVEPAPVEQSVWEEPRSQWAAEEEQNRFGNTQQEQVVAAQADGASWSVWSAGIFGTVLGAFSILRTRIGLPSRAAPQLDAVELGLAQPMYTASPEMHSASFMQAQQVALSRRALVGSSAIAAAGLAVGAFGAPAYAADDEEDDAPKAAAPKAAPAPAEPPKEEAPKAAAAPKGEPYKLSGSYKDDVAAILVKMKAATSLKRGDAEMKETVLDARDAMSKFLSLYRRNNKVAGAASYSTLYTAISTLSGHFQQYGPEYPVPEKRKKRLMQQYAEIEKQVSRGR